MSLFDDFFRTKEPPKKQIIDVREEIMPVIVSLVKDIPLLSHIDTRRIRLYATQARTDSKHGSYAKIVPMRFPDGKPSRTKKTHTETIQQISGPDGDILYLIYLYVPRFRSNPGRKNADPYPRTVPYQPGMRRNHKKSRSRRPRPFPRVVQQHAETDSP